MGQTVTTTTRADTRALTGTKADLAPLIGTWINAMPDTNHIVKVEASTRDDVLFVRLYGSSARTPVDWGEMRALPCTAPGTTEVSGFHTRYELGATRVEIAANVKLGILVIQAYTEFQDDRLSHYSREFFYQSATDRPPVSDEPFPSGDWVNTNPDTKWITGFTITGNTLNVQGAPESPEWGETTITTYLDNIDEPAFRAEYDLGPVRAVLAANTNKRIIIIAAFLHFTDDEKANFLCREFFVPR
jgi:hypothetical protein